MLTPIHTQTPRLQGHYFTGVERPVEVWPLTEEDRDTALAFLAEHPVHTVIMAGWMIERGVESPEHRGTFYGCWNPHGVLEGVALIGRVTMFETRSDAALQAFAELASQHAAVHLIFAETAELRKFWRGYARNGQKPRMLCHELLYEKAAEPLEASEVISGVRKATLAEVKEVASAHAEIISEETGENPLEKDAEGFRRRCAERIEQGKVWILMKDGELIFKADIVTGTPEAIYVEGLWVNPGYRRMGYGEICWESLTCALGAETVSICGFVNAENDTARAFYEKVGCRLRASYDKIYV